jgi:hypothetical protein
MKSSSHGASTSEAEVTNIDGFGIWLLVDDREFFLPYRDYPWFRQATVDQILDVRLPSPDHLHWPALDVDLSLASLEHPDDFPLMARH